MSFAHALFRSLRTATYGFIQPYPRALRTASLASPRCSRVISFATRPQERPMTSVDTIVRGVAGLFTTEKETPVPVELPVQGVIPPYLIGALYRNGPGVFETVHSDGQKTDRRHWFDGVGMLHRFDIDGPRNAVKYNSRVSAPGLVRAAASVPKNKYSMGFTFGVQDPCKGMFAKLFSLFMPGAGVTRDPVTGDEGQNVSVTVENVAGLGIMSRSDYSALLKFDLETLEVREFTSWTAVEVVEGKTKKDLTGTMSAAHGQYDADTQEYYNYVYNYGRDPGMFKIFCVGSTGKAEVVAEFRDYCSYVHSMALTDNYLIFILCPVRVNGIRVLFEKNFSGGMHFDKNAETKFYVISRREKRVVAVYSSEAFWMFHTINSFEDATTGDVHIDLCRYENSDCIDQFYVENLKTKPASFFAPAVATRYTLKGISTAVVSSGAKQEGAENLRAERQELCSTPLELPRFNEKYSRKPYRYAYGPGWGVNDSAADKDVHGFMMEVVKADLSEPSNVKRWAEKDTYVGEAIFVADPAGKNEDDGVLCFVAYNSARGRSALVIVDARTMVEVGRAECATRVPAGFHGNFLQRQ
jgi:torulene dioxygenase